MCVGTLATESALFSWCTMFKVSLQSFVSALALWGNRIRRSVLDGPLAGPSCFASVVLSCAFALLGVGATAAGIVFPLQSTVVHCCTTSVLAPDAAMVAMVRCVRGSEYVGAGVGAQAGRGAWSTSWGCIEVFMICVVWGSVCPPLLQQLAGTKSEGGGLPSLRGSKWR